MIKFFKIIVFLFALSSHSNSYAQQDLSHVITLEYESYQNIIEISISPISIDSALVKTIISRKIIDKKENTETKISLKKFEKLFKMALRIRTEDIIKYNEATLDGNSTRISFGDFSDNYISYNVHGLDSRDKSSKLKDFLYLTREILDIANLKIKEMN